MGAPLELDIERHTADLEGSLLTAAACNANTQLGNGSSACLLLMLHSLSPCLLTISITKEVVWYD